MRTTATTTTFTAGSGDLAEKFRTVESSIVLTAARMELPADLEGEATTFWLGLPEGPSV